MDNRNFLDWVSFGSLSVCCDPCYMLIHYYTTAIASVDVQRRSTLACAKAQADEDQQCPQIT